MNRRESSYLRWIPLLLFLLALLGLVYDERLLGSLGESIADRALFFWRPSLATLAWIFGAVVFNQISRWLLFDKLMARAIGGPVPGVLKEIAAALVYLVTITCIVGLVFDRSITGFLAALGAGGVVVGFALRGLFADVFTGLAINIDRTFVIGDWVQINEGGAEPLVAQIREIGWRCTCLTTEEQTTVVVPNSMLGMERVINISQPIEPTRFELDITVEYSVSPRHVKRVLLSALEGLVNVKGFDPTHRPAVLLGDAGSLGVEYILRYWILPWDPISPTSARDKVLSTVLHDLHVAGIAPAYPKTDVFHAKMPERQVIGQGLDSELTRLSQVDLFESLSQDELKRISDALERRVIPPKEVLIRQGEDGDSLFAVIEGLLQVEVEDENGVQLVALVHPGEYIGEMSLLTGDKRAATVRSVTESVVFEIGNQPIVECMRERPELAEQLSRKLAYRQASTQKVLDSVVEREREAELENFASQLLGRMRAYLFSGRASAPD
ncbi:MAG: mechanosensitive ion channel family protein [Lysobacterales bacterium]|jgi:small-conductance mechanosensitive channel/CRP-like cAMP-binding protein